MTGYNHYSNCTCGWCVNIGRNRSSSRFLLDELNRRSALDFLRRNFANSRAGCYVNPNAKCPECGAPVFFYSNSQGSKVYFDDLGPPWPKHPCTDSKKNQDAAVVSTKPLLRARGLRQELLDAARTAGYETSMYYARRSDNWRLLQIIDVRLDGRKSFLSGRCINSEKEEIRSFSCESAYKLFDEGDYIVELAGIFSFIHPIFLREARFENGGAVKILKEPLKDTGLGDVQQIRKAHPSRQPGVRSAQEKKNDIVLSAEELKDFPNGEIAIDEFCGQLSTIVKQYASEGSRKPADVAVRLNHDGILTVRGKKWSRRSVAFLLQRIFSGRIENSRKIPGSAKSLATDQIDIGAPNFSTNGKEPLTKQELERRLSVLGRVRAKE